MKDNHVIPFFQIRHVDGRDLKSDRARRTAIFAAIFIPDFNIFFPLRDVVFLRSGDDDGIAQLEQEGLQT